MSQPSLVTSAEATSADQAPPTISGPVAGPPSLDGSGNTILRETQNATCKCRTGGRNLVVCIDGTANQFGKKNTNVIEFYRLVKKLPGDNQLTYYNSGIGTYAKPSWKSLYYWKQVLYHTIDLAIAWNFERIVLSAYSWLSENYNEGDRIFLFGFSRGAYQVRTLAAMINKVGLIHKGNEEQIPFAYELYAADESGNSNDKPEAGDRKSDRDGGVGHDNSAEGKMRWGLWCLWCLWGLWCLWSLWCLRSGWGLGLWGLWCLSGLWGKTIVSASGRGVFDSLGGSRMAKSAADNFKYMLSRLWSGCGLGLSGLRCLCSLAGKLLVSANARGAFDGLEGNRIAKSAADCFRDTFSRLWNGWGLVLSDLWCLSGLWGKIKVSTNGSLSRASDSPGGCHTANSATANFKDTFSREAQVHFVGVWDTVSSIGIVREKVLPGTADGMKHVCTFRHALALDERRIKFLPEYVNQGLSVKEAQQLEASSSCSISSNQLNLPDTSGSRSPHAKEVWFVGTHSDIGGGNVDNTNMDRRAPSLRWMIYEAVAAGLKLNDWTTNTKPPTDVHESLTGLWWLLELLPMKHLTYKTKDGTIQQRHRGNPRLMKDGQKIHNSIMLALQDEGGRNSYSPKAIPINTMGFTWEQLGVHPISQEVYGHLEQDLFGLVERDLEECGRTISSLSDGKGTDIDGFMGSLNRWLDIEEGCQALREQNAPTKLLDAAKKVASELTDNHVAILMTALIRIGLGSQEPLLSDSPALTSKLQKDCQWSAFSKQCFPSKELFVMSGHSDGISSVAFSADSKRIVSGSYDKTIRVWDAETGSILGDPFTGHKAGVQSVAFSPDGGHIISGSGDKSIHIWNIATGTAIPGCNGEHTASVLSVAISPDGRRIVSGSHDNTIRLWDAETGSAIGKPLVHHKASVISVAFSPDGRRIASGSSDKTVRVWDATTGNTVGDPFIGHSDWVTSVIFSPDSQQIISGSDDKTVRIWNTETGTTGLGPIRGHTQYVRSVAVSYDGKRIVSGSHDGTIRLWDAQTGNAIGKPLTGHRDWIRCVAFSPNGTRVVSGSDDKTIRIWAVEGLM
ncbi:WD40 repeat-like protein [Obba rivulosa]|uniref:WD40 repeat-like protein n=1 Tax=Obba rivulosa TaxID=1052685 RepID=A0A8E2DRS0_9APHY|nr:WD40 repeat-like protein [Obba rivulosa]